MMRFPMERYGSDVGTGRIATAYTLIAVAILFRLELWWNMGDYRIPLIPATLGAVLILLAVTLLAFEGLPWKLSWTLAAALLVATVVDEAMLVLGERLLSMHVSMGGAVEGEILGALGIFLLQILLVGTLVLQARGPLAAQGASERIRTSLWSFALYVVLGGVVLAALAYVPGPLPDPLLFVLFGCIVALFAVHVALFGGIAASLRRPAEEVSPVEDASPETEPTFGAVYQTHDDAGLPSPAKERHL